MKVLGPICYFGLPAFTVLVGLATLSLRPAAKGSGITKANFDLIVKGMTQEYVEEIFGCPTGDYTNGESSSFRCGIGSPRPLCLFRNHLMASPHTGSSR